MSYCINPDCPQPKNPLRAKVCKACGKTLLLHKRYKVLKGLGQGGFGATFLAVDLSLPGNPSCVIKQLRPNTDVPQLYKMAQELFEREAQTLGRIGNHPQVPTLLNYFEDDQRFYLVQEYIKGHNLQQEVRKNGPVSEAGIRQFLSEILPMIEYIHSQEVIHRDIKPANLIRREQDKKLVLIDFGAVKNRVNADAAANTSDQTALTAFAVGTPGFAPPEQMSMRPVYASDIFALGVTCVYLMTGKSPKELNYDATTGEMQWQNNVTISDSLARVITKMMEVSVKHRYQNAQDVLGALNLEPYMDSLAQGMATAPVKKDDPPAPTNTNNSYGRSPNSKLAMAIRSRRQKPNNIVTNTNLTGGNTTRIQHHTAGQLRNQGKKAIRKQTIKFDRTSIIDSYGKGRRDFGQQNLNHINLSQENLSGSIFHQSRLTKANLQGSNLTNVDFGKANLAQANLRDASLARAYFSNANLAGADLRGADLSFAYFNNAMVEGANFCGANLTNAKITEQQLKLAKTNWSTIMPNGKRGLWS